MQPQLNQVMCCKCNAWYGSERELLDHKIMFHREFGSEQGRSQLNSSRVASREKNIGSSTATANDEYELDQLLWLASTFQTSSPR